ncbi:MAG: NAD(P)/FAD-dependent oxidoreductase [Geminicoccaceae bacterium]
MTEVDAAVVGAGAAGVAAARALADAGLSVLVLEARDRIGGRAWTARIEGHTADIGCAWLHSADRNPWVPIAESFGLGIDRKLPDWGVHFMRERQLGRAEASARGKAFERWWTELDEYAGPDRAWSDLLQADDPWLPAFACVNGFISGAGPDRLSVVDLARYADTMVNWRVVEGYGTLVERHARGLPIRLSTPVQAIDHRGCSIVVTTASGPITARTVIVTVPSSVLAAESIRFDPPLPSEKLTAAAQVPLGHASKLLLTVEGDPFGLEPDRQVLGKPAASETAIYHLRFLGRPLVEAYWGGPLAREMEHAGIGAMGAFAIEELAAIFGENVRRHLRPALASTWSVEPWSLGAFSYAVPGGSDARPVLARPIDDRIFFAGEACSTDHYSTAHGAYLTGLAAAEAVRRALSHVSSE